MPWFWLGLLVEPYAGGIHKDPSTPSYYFVTVGLAIFLLIAIYVLVVCFIIHLVFKLLIDNGQNPMVSNVLV
jgi:predicted acyltransferase